MPILANEASNVEWGVITPFSKPTAKCTGRFLSTTTMLQVMLPGGEHVEQEQVHQTAQHSSAEPRSRIVKHNCEAQRGPVQG